MNSLSFSLKLLGIGITLLSLKVDRMTVLCMSSISGISEMTSSINFW